MFQIRNTCRGYLIMLHSDGYTIYGNRIYVFCRTLIVGTTKRNKMRQRKNNFLIHLSNRPTTAAATYTRYSTTLNNVQLHTAKCFRSKTYLFKVMIKQRRNLSECNHVVEHDFSDFARQKLDQSNHDFLPLFD